jgi:uncharacterized Zn finger protein
MPVAERRTSGRREVAALVQKEGRDPAPIVISGRNIANTFWGKAWCAHLESLGDLANRLPRGRTYARNRSIVDLVIEEGAVRAYVQGSSLYRVHVAIEKLPRIRWKAIVKRCGGEIDSLVELLGGELSDGVMKVITDPANGLFPRSNEISMSCSCPDYATMCKHVAATLYGVGARLDAEPALLFTLRGVDQSELVASDAVAVVTSRARGGARVLADEELAAIFGIELDFAGVTDRATGAATKRGASKRSKRSKGS